MADDPAMEKILIEHSAAIEGLCATARGRKDNGRPLGAEAARQAARMVLTTLGLDWKENG